MNTKKKRILAVATTTFLSASLQADLIVQWGAIGGDTGIVTTAGNTSGQNAFPAAYNPSTLVNPADGDGGYDVNAPNQTREFSGAQTDGFGGGVFVDNGGGDYMQLIANLGGVGTFGNMTAWSAADFLPNTGDELKSFQIDYRPRDNGDTATVHFLLETSLGWYQTDQTDTSSVNTFGSWDASAASLTWSPFSEFGVSGGTPASADLSDVVSVGFYTTTVSPAGVFAGSFVRGFSVQNAAIPEPSALGLLGWGMGVVMAVRRKRRRA